MYLKVVYWLQRINTGNSSILKAKKHIFVIFSCILQILPDQQEVWLEVSDNKSCEISSWINNKQSSPSNPPSAPVLWYGHHHPCLGGGAHGDVLELGLLDPDVPVPMHLSSLEVRRPVRWASVLYEVQCSVNLTS